MQETSALYKEIISLEHTVEFRVVIGERGRLIDKRGDYIVFGGTRILTDRGGPDAGYAENMILSIKTSDGVFSGSSPSVGNAIAGEIELRMLKPTSEIGRMAQMVPYIRLTDGSRYTEWIQKGVYYIDTREETKNDDGNDILTIHGYDAMLMAEQPYPNDPAHSYPLRDTTVVQVCATAMGVGVDARTNELMNKRYSIGLPVGYSIRETLKNIAAMYAGNFIMTETGDLRLVGLTEIPPETRLLIDEFGYTITFGGTRIKV